MFRQTYAYTVNVNVKAAPTGVAPEQLADFIEGVHAASRTDEWAEIATFEVVTPEMLTDITELVADEAPPSCHGLHVMAVLNNAGDMITLYLFPDTQRLIVNEETDEVTFAPADEIGVESDEGLDEVEVEMYPLTDEMKDILSAPVDAYISEAAWKLALINQLTTELFDLANEE